LKPDFRVTGIVAVVVTHPVFAGLVMYHAKCNFVALGLDIVLVAQKEQEQNEKGIDVFHGSHFGFADKVHAFVVASLRVRLPPFYIYFEIILSCNR
jgi:uncharacterized membrane protein (DUF4010 family)